MPKEQPSFSEQSPCATASKSAKDKSNCSTLLAIRDSSGRVSHCSSEKDSGYSDGSDWQQTDVDGQHGNKGRSRGSECAETDQAGHNQECVQANPGNSTITSAARELPPIYVFKNMVLQQTDEIQNRGQLLWRNKSSETSGSVLPHMILCQQPILLPTSLQLQKPLSRKTSLPGKKVNSTYLPIFNSYPRIAPHPSKKPPDKSSSNDESQNLRKRVCTEHMSESTKSLPEQHLHMQPKLTVAASGQPCSSSLKDTVSSAASSKRCFQPATSGHTTTSTLHATRGFHRNAPTNARHRRFLNTLDILRQSGLLEITLRTKELLRQSNATEQDIAQLRQHTQLLCQAASNPSCGLDGITAWEHLHRAMAKSCSYPNLKLLQNLQVLPHPDISGHPENTATGDTTGPQGADNRDVPSSHHLTTLLDPNHRCPLSEQSRKPGSSEKSFIPPDSSTG